MFIESLEWYHTSMIAFQVRWPTVWLKGVWLQKGRCGLECLLSACVYFFGVWVQGLFAPCFFFCFCCCVWFLFLFAVGWCVCVLGLLLVPYLCAGLFFLCVGFCFCCLSFQSCLIKFALFKKKKNDCISS